MDSVILIVTVCFSGACREVRLPYDVSVETCQSVAQESISQWVAEHPSYKVTKWKCEKLGEGEDDL
jgi:hypothetical protein